jgi:hypothetical protein
LKNTDVTLPATQLKLRGSDADTVMGLWGSGNNPALLLTACREFYIRAYLPLRILLIGGRTVEVE